MKVSSGSADEVQEVEVFSWMLNPSVVLLLLEMLHSHVTSLGEDNWQQSEV